MAIQTQQSTGRLVGMWRTALGAAATVVVGAAFVTGGLSWQQGVFAPAAQPETARVTRNVQLGIDVPAGANLDALPAGVTDYIRAGTRPVASAKQAVIGQGALVAVQVFDGATYRTAPVAVGAEQGAARAPRAMAPSRWTSPALGAQAPHGVAVESLPQGYRDYIRPDSQDAPTRVRFVALGAQAPHGVAVESLPQGYRDYIRLNAGGN